LFVDFYIFVRKYNAQIMGLDDQRTRVRQPGEQTVELPCPAVSATYSVSANVLLPGGKGPGRKTYRSLLLFANFTVRNLIGLLLISLTTSKKSTYKLILKSNYIIVIQSLRLE